MINIAICDDEKSSVNIIKGAVINYFESSNVEVNAISYFSAKELTNALKFNIYDLLFLDIEMPFIDGIQLGKYLREKSVASKIIYVSNREDRIFEALEVRPYGFVRKSAFLKDITKILDEFLSDYKNKKTKDIIFNAADGIRSIPIASIEHVESLRNQQYFYVENINDPIVAYGTSLEKINEILDEYGFIRTHKSFLVNYKFISLITASDVVLINNRKIPLSRRKIKEVKERYLTLVQNTSIFA